MEILQILLEFFATELGGGALKPILGLLEENSFDIKKALQNVNLQSLTPLLKELMQNENPPQSGGKGYGLAPIAGVADKDIVFTLNKYLGD